MDKPETKRRIAGLIERITALRAQCLAFEKAHADAVRAAAPGYRRSARNLLHYLALRQHDLRDLQEELSQLGLSSLGRLEAHTMATLDAVLKTLHRLADRPSPAIGSQDTPVDFVSGPETLRRHAESLLGAGARKAPGADHGDHADRGGVRSGGDPQPDGSGHERHADQLRP